MPGEGDDYYTVRVPYHKYGEHRVRFVETDLWSDYYICDRCGMRDQYGSKYAFIEKPCGGRPSTRFRPVPEHRAVEGFQEVDEDAQA